jgi:hypothetical protein
MKRLLLLLLLTISAPPAARAQRADSMPPSDAYLDTSAAQLVRLARERRQVADLSIESYKATSKERISAGLRGIRRDRLLYRREVAGRLEWSRNGPGRIEILGAREVVPIAIKGVQLPSDLGSFMPHLAFDPADNRMLLGWDDDEFVRHPLAPNAEQHYKFKTGGTTSIRLPDGRQIRLIELEIIPRKTDPHNISGSFWLDAETHGVVQAVFRLARDIDIVRDLDDEDDDDDVPRFIRPLKAAVDYVTIEYGLYDLKWWLPRLIAFEGVVRAGFIRMPLHYERTYSNYEIVGSAQPISMPRAEILRRDSIARAEGRDASAGSVDPDSCRSRMRITVRAGARKADTPADSSQVMQCGRWEIVMSADTAALLSSAELPADVFATGEQLITEGELRELGERVEKLGGPSALSQVLPDVSLLSVARMRYNRVEALSAAAYGELDYGVYRASATARIGVADLEPNFEIELQRPGETHAITLGGYRRLHPFDPYARPFSFGASISALAFGRDDADYYRSLGVELKAEPSGAASRWYSARLFAQKESAAKKETDFSFRHVFNGDYVFRSNLAADKIDAYGGELTLRASRGLNPDGLRMGGEAYAHGAIGTTDFSRGALTLRLGFPLPGKLSAALESAAGVTSVSSPLQHLWYLGGTNTLRGYHAGVLSGETFWRGRAEIGYGLPAVRLVGFSDVGWAGDRNQFSAGRPLLSVGAGASVLDGIIRLDVARGLREPKGWSAMLYFDAVL